MANSPKLKDRVVIAKVLPLHPHLHFIPACACSADRSSDSPLFQHRLPVASNANAIAMPSTAVPLTGIGWGCQMETLHYQWQVQPAAQKHNLF